MQRRRNEACNELLWRDSIAERWIFEMEQFSWLLEYWDKPWKRESDEMISDRLISHLILFILADVIRPSRQTSKCRDEHTCQWFDELCRCFSSRYQLWQWQYSVSRWKYRLWGIMKMENDLNSSLDPNSIFTMSKSIWSILDVSLFSFLLWLVE